MSQANIYEHENDLQQAYMLLYRHARIVLDHIPKHPDAKNVRYRERIAQARKAVLRNIGKLEALKPRINKRYEAYQEKLRMRRAQIEKEMHLSGTEERPATPEGASAETPAYQDAAVAMVNEKSLHKSIAEDNDHFTSMRRVRDHIDQSSRPLVEPQRVDQSTNELHHHLPTPSTSSNDTWKQPLHRVSSGDYPGPPVPVKQPLASNAPPIRPPKLADGNGPPRPPKTLNDSDGQPMIFRSSAQTEGGDPLRPLFLPTPLKAAFLEVASLNTAKGIETCGMLCGTLLRNALFVTHLVIPAQKGTPDTCEMINEEALHAWIEEESIEATIDQAGRQMMQLGWIHTHPTQTAFMSSADLHTHVYHQSSLPEYIAVVCAPRQVHGQDYKIFRMTDPPGLPTIRGCKRPGTFHPHDNPPGGLYTECAGRPGHVVEHKDLAFGVVDLRDRV